MEWADGDVTTIRATDDPAIIHVRTDWTDGNHTVETSAWGLWDLETIEITGEPPSWTSYGVPSSEMPRPAAETRVTFPRVAYLGSGFPPVYHEVYHMGPQGRVTLAGCTFRAFEVTLERMALNLVPADDPERSPRVARGWAYLVDLGFAVISWHGPPESRQLAPDVIAIEPVP